MEASGIELVGAKPDLLLSRSTPTTAALNNERGLIPLVFVNVAEPVEQGFVQSLARPGGNITGFTNLEASVGSKMLQLLKEIDPADRSGCRHLQPADGTIRRIVCATHGVGPC